MKEGTGERTGFHVASGPTYTALPGVLQGAYMPDKEDKCSQGLGQIIK